MKFYIDYLDSEGDLNHYWTDALTQEEAERLCAKVESLIWFFGYYNFLAVEYLLQKNPPPKNSEEDFSI